MRPNKLVSKCYYFDYCFLVKVYFITDTMCILSSFDPILGHAINFRGGEPSMAKAKAKAICCFCC